MAVVGPPSFLIGMTFPFVQRAVQQDLASVGARVGWVQLANILGNAAGSLLTGLVTLHLLGTAGTLRLLAALSLALAARLGVAASRHGAAPGARTAALARGGCCLAALLAVARPTPPSGSAHARPGAGPADAWGEDRSGVAFCRERPAAPAAATAAAARFFIMGYAPGPHALPAVQHCCSASLGPLLHPDPRRVLADRRRQRRHALGRRGGARRRARCAASSWSAPVLDVLQRHRRAASRTGPWRRCSPTRACALEYGDGRRALARGDAAATT